MQVELRAAIWKGRQIVLYGYCLSFHPHNWSAGHCDKPKPAIPLGFRTLSDYFSPNYAQRSAMKKYQQISNIPNRLWWYNLHCPREINVILTLWIIEEQWRVECPWVQWAAILRFPNWEPFKWIEAVWTNQWFFRWKKVSPITLIEELVIFFGTPSSEWATFVSRTQLGTVENFY